MIALALLIVASWIVGTAASVLMYAGWTGTFDSFGANRAAFASGAAIVCAAVIAAVSGLWFG